MLLNVAQRINVFVQIAQDIIIPILWSPRNIRLQNNYNMVHRRFNFLKKGNEWITNYIRNTKNP